jgi:hypothetical protein
MSSGRSSSVCRVCLSMDAPDEEIMQGIHLAADAGHCPDPATP